MNGNEILYLALISELRWMFLLHWVARQIQKAIHVEHIYLHRSLFPRISVKAHIKYEELSILRAKLFGKYKPPSAGLRSIRTGKIVPSLLKHRSVLTLQIDANISYRLEREGSIHKHFQRKTPECTHNVPKIALFYRHQTTWVDHERFSASSTVLRAGYFSMPMNRIGPNLRLLPFWTQSWSQKSCCLMYPCKMQFILQSKQSLQTNITSLCQAIPLRNQKCSSTTCERKPISLWRIWQIPFQVRCHFLTKEDFKTKPHANVQTTAVLRNISTRPAKHIAVEVVLQRFCQDANFTYQLGSVGIQSHHTPRKSLLTPIKYSFTPWKMSTLF